MAMKKDPSCLDTSGSQLESMLQNQSSLIGDLREVSSRFLHRFHLPVSCSRLNI